MAACAPFSFGEFKLFEGKDAYTMIEASIQNYFDELRCDVVGVCYGSYFLEIADYYTRENNDEAKMLKLLYISLRALLKEQLPDSLIRAVFELKSIMLNGEFPGPSYAGNISQTCEYTMNYIENTPLEKLYSFTLKQDALEELSRVSQYYCHQIMNTNFKSLTILETLV